MNLFKKCKDKLIAQDQTVVVAVPDIKEYLIREYEKVRSLRLQNEQLEAELEAARELKLKYDAALVTLDEYSKRLERADSTVLNEKQKVINIRNENESLRDKINSYKIKLQDAALTKDEIKNEIVEEVKNALILKVNSEKGNMSKKRVCELVMEVTI